MFELYSDRIRRENGELDVYTYEVFPTEFRNQCYLVLTRFFEHISKTNREYWDFEEQLAKRFFELKGEKCVIGKEYYFEHCNDVDFFDYFHYMFSYVSKKIFLENLGIDYKYGEEATECINTYLKRQALGYEVIGGDVIKKTNTVTHENIVKPALKLLIEEKFRGAEEEYLLAFEHFRTENYEDAILNAMKAFESCMKIICTELGYPFAPDRDTASKLISILSENQFFPSYLSDYMVGGSKTLGSGLPTLRNRDGGHGQGADVREVGEEFVEYALNLAATNIVFLHKLYTKKVTP